MSHFVFMWSELYICLVDRAQMQKRALHVFSLPLVSGQIKSTELYSKFFLRLQYYCYLWSLFKTYTNCPVHLEWISDHFDQILWFILHLTCLICLNWTLVPLPLSCRFICAGVKAVHRTLVWTKQKTSLWLSLVWSTWVWKRTWHKYVCMYV